MIGWLTVFSVLSLTVCGGGVCLAESLPSGEEVVRRVLGRARALAQAGQVPEYSYHKEMLVEELDERGQTVKSELRVYHGRWVRGVPLDRLVEIRGRRLSAAEFRREAQREERLRQRFAGVDFRRKAAEREAWITEQLLGRYEFQVCERAIFRDRTMLVVSFHAKAEKAASKTLADKFLNRLVGTAWVDEADEDVARFRIRLCEPVSFGLFGILGAVTQCEAESERLRMPGGVWVPLQQSLLVKGRFAFRPLRYRVTETFSGYRPVEEAQ